MKLVLSKNVKGINTNDGMERLHAKAGDVLPVLLRKGINAFICESVYYPNTEIVVFKSQIAKIEEEYDIPDHNEEDATESDVYTGGEIDEYFEHIEE